MRRLVKRPISESFRPYFSAQVHSEYRKQVYYSGRRIFNPVTWISGGIAFAIALGYLDPRIHAVVVAVGIGLLVSYLRIHGSAERLTIRRRVPELATVGDELEIGIEIVNGGRRAIRDLVVRDRFSGAREAQIAFRVADWIEPGRTWRGSYRRVCDAGMGLHTFSNLSVAVADPLGLFEFRIEEDSLAGLAIYPEPSPIPDLKISSRRESFAHGQYDTELRGGSTNFAGLRNYARGDSMRKISWRASARKGKLIVKEFEVAADTDVTIILDMAAERHASADSDASWEQAKDAALSILAQQLALGNRVALHSQDVHVPLGGGESHLNLIAKSIFGLRPVSDSGGKLANLFSSIAPGTTAVYVGGFLGADGDPFAGVRELIRKLSVLGVQTICLLVDSASFVPVGSRTSLDQVTVARLESTHVRVTAEQWTLAIGGAQAFILEFGVPVGRALLGAQRGKADV